MVSIRFSWLATKFGKASFFKVTFTNFLWSLKRMDQNNGKYFKWSKKIWKIYFEKWRIGTNFKNLVDSNSISKEMHKFVKPVGTRPGVMYGNCKVHNQQVDGCCSFRPILSALETPTYNLAKFLVPKLNTLTKNDYQLKIHFNLLKRYVSKTQYYLWIV